MYVTSTQRRGLHEKNLFVRDRHRDTGTGAERTSQLSSHRIIPRTVRLFVYLINWRQKRGARINFIIILQCQNITWTWAKRHLILYRAVVRHQRRNRFKIHPRVRWRSTTSFTIRTINTGQGPCSSTHPSNLISIYLSANLLIVISPKENKKCLAVVETVAVVLAASAAAAAAGTLRFPFIQSLLFN